MESNIANTKATDPLAVTKEMTLYCISKGLKECEHLRGLRNATESHPRSRMMGSPDEAALFAIILQFARATRVIEVGVFTGYTTLALAKAVGPSGKVFGLDVSEEFVSIGREWWKRAGVNDRIDVTIAPALDTLRNYASQKEMVDSIDFAFIDADKPNYSNYFDALIPLMRIGGVIAVDNTLWHGAVVNPSINDEDTVAIRAIADKVKNDSRFDTSMVPIGDGVLFARLIRK